MATFSMNVGRDLSQLNLATSLHSHLSTSIFLFSKSKFVSSSIQASNWINFSAKIWHY